MPKKQKSGKEKGPCGRLYGSGSCRPQRDRYADAHGGPTHGGINMLAADVTSKGICANCEPWRKDLRSQRTMLSEDRQDLIPVLT